jgi:uncharacterized membrane protein YraQ (UPF0718 family)
MDRVRFGRALGQGTREAARALLQAADAATAPDPNPAVPQTPRPEPTVPRVAAQTRRKIQTTQAGVKAGSRNFVQATMAPVKRASGILWLEVTGTLFALVAFSGAIEIYRFRAALHSAGASASSDHRNLLLAAGIFVFFGSCAISSFVRAGRKSRGA